MNDNRWAIIFLATMSFVLGSLLVFLLTLSARQQADVRKHRLRNEAVHTELLEFMKCALALPPAPERTVADLNRCEREAARKIEGTYPPEGQP